MIKYVYGVQNSPITVKCDDKKVGTIKPVEGGW